MRKSQWMVAFALDHRIMQKKTLTRPLGRQAWIGENRDSYTACQFGRSRAALEQNRSTSHGYENEWEEAHDG